jgi:CheY-like chemotaxis protein
VSSAIKILVVDDNQDAADLQAAVLRSMGHETAVAYTGKAAIEAAATFPARLFLLDLALPDMDGYELVRRLRAIAHRDARFVALTGYAPGTGGNLADKLFDEHLLKPMAPEIIEEVIKLVPRTGD